MDQIGSQIGLALAVDNHLYGHLLEGYELVSFDGSLIVRLIDDAKIAPT
jgi:hypothetical protein